MTDQTHPTRGKVLVVAGPTASGKSALALDVAAAFEGTVINADSMQVYSELRVLSARPGAADEARVPHKLYGVLSGAELCSVARWRAMAVAEIEAAWDAGRLPIVTGGTGLYFTALMQGLSDVPEVPDQVRAEGRALFRDLGNEAFHGRLAAEDPVMGARLRVSDSQRLMRAWEVLQATGRSLADWQAAGPSIPPLAAEFLVVVLMPPRQVLHANCEARFDQMMAQGALEEVRDLVALNLDPALPVMKALGVPELTQHLAGEVSLEAAIEKAKTGTRRYIKRQSTWFRNQMDIADYFSAQYSERIREEIFHKVRQKLLTTTD